MNSSSTLSQRGRDSVGDELIHRDTYGLHSRLTLRELSQVRPHCPRTHPPARARARLARRWRRVTVEAGHAVLAEVRGHLGAHGGADGPQFHPNALCSCLANRAIGTTGVDQISLGTLTNDIRVIDLSMRVELS